MASGIVATFIERLLESEATGRPGPVAEVFEPGARLERPVRGGAEPQPPLEFWRRYLGSFERIGSEFTAVTESEGFAALEWVSRATLRGGREVEYRGVTLLEHEQGRLHAMRTYYDSAPLNEATVVEAKREAPGRDRAEHPEAGGAAQRPGSGVEEEREHSGRDAPGRGSSKGDGRESAAGPGGEHGA